jgi:hypothetical protein
MSTNGITFTPQEQSWLADAKNQIKSRDSSSKSALDTLRLNGESASDSHKPIRKIVIEKLLKDSKPTDLFKLLIVIPHTFFNNPEITDSIEQLATDRSNTQGINTLIDFCKDHLSKTHLNPEDIIPLLELIVKKFPNDFVKNYPHFRLPHQIAIRLLEIYYEKDAYLSKKEHEAERKICILVEAFQANREAFIKHLGDYPEILRHLPLPEIPEILKEYEEVSRHFFLNDYEKFNILPEQAIPILLSYASTDSEKIDLKLRFIENLWKYPFILEENHLEPHQKAEFITEFLYSYSVLRITIDQATPILKKIFEIDPRAFAENFEHYPFILKKLNDYNISLSTVKINPSLIQFVPTEVLAQDPAFDVISISAPDSDRLSRYDNCII